MSKINEFNASDFNHILHDLIRQPSVVGYETSFFRVIQRELEEIGINVSRFQGILVASGNDPDLLYLSSHVDRHGLVCTGQNEFAYAAFVAQQKGDQMGDSVSEQMINTLAERFESQQVQAYEPWSGVYLGSGVIKNAFVCPRRDNLIFEIDGLGYIEPNIPIAYLDRLEYNDETISAQLDNVISVALLIYLYHLGYQGTGFFTAQEEVGRSWRFLYDWFRRFDKSTDELIVLDTSPFSTLETIYEHDIVLRERDSSAKFNLNVVKKLNEIADKKNISVVYKDKYIDEKNKIREEQGLSLFTVGRTEMGRIINASGNNISGATLQIPTTGYHTASETARIKSVEAISDIIFDYIEFKNLKK